MGISDLSLKLFENPVLISETIVGQGVVIDSETVALPTLVAPSYGHGGIYPPERRTTYRIKPVDGVIPEQLETYDSQGKRWPDNAGIIAVEQVYSNGRKRTICRQG